MGLFLKREVYRVIHRTCRLNFFSIVTQVQIYRSKKVGVIIQGVFLEV